jgi:hypothetical protein
MPGAATGSVSGDQRHVNSHGCLLLYASIIILYPYFQQGAKLTNSSTNATQGSYVSVSADGNTAIVGAPGDDSDKGAAWIYVQKRYHLERSRPNW